MHPRWRRHTNLATSGYHGRSRYDADVALYAAMSTVPAGVLQRRLRRTPSEELRKWNITEETARTWASARVEVTIIAANQAMVNMLREAVGFVQNLASRYSPDEVKQDAKEDSLTVTCVSANGVQGETFDCAVLALPPETTQ